MPLTVHEQAADAVNFNNVKVIGEGPAYSYGLSQQNQIAQQQRLNDSAANIHALALAGAQQIHQLSAEGAQQVHQLSAQGAQQLAGAQGNLTLALTARTAHTLLNAAEQSAAFGKTMEGLAGSIANLEAGLAGGQQMAKIANTTPPETAIAQQVVNMLLPVLSSLSAAIEALGAGGGNAATR